MALGEAQRRALVAAGLAVLAAGVFAPTLGHEWLNYDDDVYITANPGLALGLSPAGIGWAFSTFHGANWFPLTWLSWLVDAELFGLDPAGFHATNLLLHAVATALLFLALVRMTGHAARSAFVAAVFAVHPLHVEPVAWAAGRKDPLSAVFFAAALLVWAGCGRGRASPRRVAGVSALLALGLMAKPTLVTLPFVLLLLDAWPLERVVRSASDRRLDPGALRRAAAEKWPLFVLVAASSLVTVLAQRSGGALANLAQLPLADRLANAAVAAASYVVQAVVPTGLAVFYPHPGASLAGWKVAASLAALGVVTAAALRLWRSVPALTVGWLWFLGMLVPVIGVVQVGAQAMADRYTYLPLIGLALAVAWGVPEAVARLAGGGRATRRGLLAGGCVAVAALALASSVQLRHWRDSESLMRRALAVTRDNHIAHAYLGVALLQRGDVPGALREWRASAALEPGDLTVANNLAWLLATTPDRRNRSPEEAVAHAERARRIAGEDPAVLDTLAAAYAAAGRFDRARATARRALEIAEADDPALAAGIRERLARYRARRPYVDR